MMLGSNPVRSNSKGTLYHYSKASGAVESNPYYLFLMKFKLRKLNIAFRISAHQNSQDLDSFRLKGCEFYWLDFKKV